jgi:hypothetical protein
MCPSERLHNVKSLSKFPEMAELLYDRKIAQVENGIGPFY